MATSPNYLTTSAVLNKYAHKISLIPIGLDKSSDPQALPTFQQYWCKRLGAKFFICCGVLRHYKGLHILLDAANGIDYPILIVGTGPIEEELKAQVARLGLQNLNSLGQLSDQDKVALLKWADALSSVNGSSLRLRK